jgi:hypothetical protein
MSKKSKPKGDNADPEMWIRPGSNLKGDRGERAWDGRPGGIPNSTRYLELADLALGLKKPEAKKKKAVGSLHSPKKTEPYSR